MLELARRARSGPVTSAEVAWSVSSHAVVTRRVLARLRRAGLIACKRGANGGYTVRDADVTLREVYDAVVDHEANALGWYPEGAPNRRCRVAPHISARLAEVGESANAALQDALAKRTIAELAAEVSEKLAGGRRTRRDE